MEKEFDYKITDLVNNGQTREAAALAKRVAVHALLTFSGINFARLQDTQQAKKAIESALVIDPGNPILYSNLAYLLTTEELLDQALEVALAGTKLQDVPADLWYNLGIIYKNLARPRAAVEAFRKARDLNPTCAMTHCQLANVLLPTGEFEEGLREDEWRFKAHSGLRSCRNRYNKPDWDGKEDLTGKRIIVFNEQGLGDGIQFMRYIPCLKALGAYVIYEIQKPLVTLCKNCPYIDEVIERLDNHLETDFPPYDLVISVGSLPYHFDPKLEKIPLETPYLWPTSRQILLNNGKLNVGIVWAGSPWHSDDRDRSCFLKYFKPLNQVNVNLFSFQQGNMTRSWSKGNSVLWEGNDKFEVVNLIEGAENVERVELADFLTDMNETAVLLKEMDLFIAVDTAIAHLAGALGIKTWLLLPWAHEWRWLKNWYPTMRIIRQPSAKDWEGLLNQVGKELAEFAL